MPTIKVQQVSFNANSQQVLVYMSNGDRQIKIPIDIQYLKSVLSLAGSMAIETADTDVIGKDGNKDTVIYYLIEK